ncbi:MAG TPA: ABC transporter permease [Longimicrobiales bacterium]|nr:ABC transporter permease [Longimicrobiales bacterium]
MSPRGPLDDPDRAPPEELRAEVSFYLEERVRELVAEGMDPDEARRIARRAFGDVNEVVAELERIERGRNREARMRALMSGLRRDFSFALRGLARSPGFTAVAVLTLGLGIGAVTAIFSVVNASLLRSLPFTDGDELVFIQGAYAAPEGPAIRGASPPEARDWEELSRSFAEMSVADGTSFTLTGNGPAEVIGAERVDEGYLEMLRVEPLLGRGFTDEELSVPATHFVTLLGHDLWTRRYGADPEVLGGTLTLDGRPWTIVGILPAGFRGTTLSADLLVPLATLSEEALSSRGNRFLSVLARLAPGVGVEEAQADMDGVAARLEEAHPQDHEDRIALVTPAREFYLGTTRALMLVVLGAAGLLLLITAANIANLLLVKATAREGEVVVRSALGAGRGQLLGQFVVESLVLSALGAALGLLLGVWGAGALTAAMPQALLPAFVEVRPDATVFLLVTALMSLVGLVVGLVPGLTAVRRDVAGALRAQGRGGLHASKLQSALVVGEVAAALLLLISAGLMTRSLQAQLRVEPGYDFEALYGFSLFLAEEQYAANEVRPALEELLASLEQRPEVAQATIMSDLPLRSGFTATYLWIGDAVADEDRIRFYLHRVGSDWFETMGTPLVRGRPIEEADAAAELPVVVVSEALADRYFGDADPLGQSIYLGGRDGSPFTVVGVAEDVRYRDLTSDIRLGFDDPDVYLPWERFPNRSVSIALRPRAGDPAALDPVARRVTADFDPLLPLVSAGPLADDLRSETAQARFGSILLAVFSVLALALSLIGLYGVVAFAAGRRTREIALRIALGAGRARVRRMVVWHGLRLTALGLIAGVALAALAGRSLAAFLYGVEPLDPLTFAAVGALMAGAAALAAWVPAVQATRVDPQQALRNE